MAFRPPKVTNFSNRGTRGGRPPSSSTMASLGAGDFRAKQMGMSSFGAGDFRAKDPSSNITRSSGDGLPSKNASSGAGDLNSQMYSDNSSDIRMKDARTTSNLPKVSYSKNNLPKVNHSSLGAGDVRAKMDPSFNMSSTSSPESPENYGKVKSTVHRVVKKTDALPAAWSYKQRAVLANLVNSYDDVSGDEDEDGGGGDGKENHMYNFKIGVDSAGGRHISTSPLAQRNEEHPSKTEDLRHLLSAKQEARGNQNSPSAVKTRGVGTSYSRRGRGAHAVKAATGLVSFFDNTFSFL